MLLVFFSGYAWLLSFAEPKQKKDKGGGEEVKYIYIFFFRMGEASILAHVGSTNRLGSWLPDVV